MAAKPEPDDGEVVFELEVELDDEYLWRVGRFTSLGFDPFMATRLAMAEVDWHDAEKLLVGGCPMDRIYDILS